MNSLFFPIATVYLVIMNLLGFAMMGIDKKRAVRGAWRISEASLFGAALLGGALGSTLGMHFFHHKTRHWYFRYGLPAIFVAQALFLGWLAIRLLTSSVVLQSSGFKPSPQSCIAAASNLLRSPT